MNLISPPYSNEDEYISTTPRVPSTTVGSYVNPTAPLANQSPTYSNPISRAFGSVGDYLTSSFQTQPTEPFKPTVTGISRLDDRFREAHPRSQFFYENNAERVTDMPSNMDVIGNQLRNSWGELGLGGQINAGAKTVSGLLQAYTGHKEAKLAKAQMRFNMNAWNKEYGNAVQDVNRGLRDRQQLRNYYNPDVYSSPDDYVAKYGAK